MLTALPLLGVVGFATAASAQTVAIVGYINGQPATASSTGSASFPITATWRDPNVNSGAAQSAQFSLGVTGVNNSSPYQATTNTLSAGSNYSASLNSQSWCSANSPFMPAGYSSGTSLQNAAAATVNATPPGFTNLQGNEFEVVWLRTCPPAPTPVIPASGASLTGNQYTEADWTAVTDPAMPISYLYEISNASTTASDGSLQSPTFVSGALTTPTIPTTNTAPGTYFWNVRARDAAGNLSPWSSASSVTVTASSSTGEVTGTVTGTTTPPGEEQDNCHHHDTVVTIVIKHESGDSDDSTSSEDMIPNQPQDLNTYGYGNPESDVQFPTSAPIPFGPDGQTSQQSIGSPPGSGEFGMNFMPGFGPGLQQTEGFGPSSLQGIMPQQMMPPTPGTPGLGFGGQNFGSSFRQQRGQGFGQRFGGNFGQQGMFGA